MKHGISFSLLPFFTYHAYIAWCSTLRFSFTGSDFLFTTWEQGSSFILALWHDELFPAIFAPRRIGNFKLMTVASQSRDGEFITAVLQRLGYIVARGSSSRGGLKVLLSMAHTMRKEKVCSAITVDGPKGPRHKVKDGIFFLASKTGVPIIPMRCSLSHAKIFSRSWDHFQLPLPFSCVKVHFGEPLVLSEQKLDESALKPMRLSLETALTHLCD